MSLADEKRDVRLSAQNKRNTIASSVAPGAGERLASNVLNLISSLSVPRFVSGFLPIGSEIDIGPCMSRLRQRGLITCLPIVLKKAHPLVFRVWKEGDELESGPLKTRQPGVTASEVRPDILLVPLLAFDLRGYRLGWGGGFYDRTLAAYKMAGWRITTIGVGYDAQQMDQVPAGEFDVPMDWIVTEKRILEIMKATD